jgi:hypothetical protein
MRPGITKTATYDNTPGVCAGVGGNILIACSNPGVSTSGIDQKGVYDPSVLEERIDDKHTVCRRGANTNLSRVEYCGIRGAERPTAGSAFSEVGELLQGLCAGSVLLNKVAEASGVDFRGNFESSLAGITAHRTRLHSTKVQQ